MDWPVALVCVTAMLCGTACYLAPMLTPNPHTERTAAMGFHVGHTDTDED